MLRWEISLILKVCFPLHTQTCNKILCNILKKFLQLRSACYENNNINVPLTRCNVFMSLYSAADGTCFVMLVLADYMDWKFTPLDA